MPKAESVGVACPTVSVIVAVEVLYLPVSDGVSVAVIVELPAPTTVTVDPDTVATELFDDA